jgi:hypothetical protein
MPDAPLAEAGQRVRWTRFGDVLIGDSDHIPNIVYVFMSECAGLWSAEDEEGVVIGGGELDSVAAAKQAAEQWMIQAVQARQERFNLPLPESAVQWRRGDIHGWPAGWQRLYAIINGHRMDVQWSDSSGIYCWRPASNAAGVTLHAKSVEQAKQEAEEWARSRSRPVAPGLPLPEAYRAGQAVRWVAKRLPEFDHTFMSEYLEGSFPGRSLRMQVYQQRNRGRGARWVYHVVEHVRSTKCPWTGTMRGGRADTQARAKRMAENEARSIIAHAHVKNVQAGPPVPDLDLPEAAQRRSFEPYEVSLAVRYDGPGFDEVMHVLADFDGQHVGAGGGTNDYVFTVPYNKLDVFKREVRNLIGRSAIMGVGRKSEMQRQDELADQLYALSHQLWGVNHQLNRHRPADADLRARYGFKDAAYRDEQAYVSKHRLRARTGLQDWSPLMVWEYLALRDAGIIGKDGKIPPPAKTELPAPDMPTESVESGDVTWESRPSALCLGDVGLVAELSPYVIEVCGRERGQAEWGVFWRRHGERATHSDCGGMEPSIDAAKEAAIKAVSELAQAPKSIAGQALWYNQKHKREDHQLPLPEAFSKLF